MATEVARLVATLEADVRGFEKDLRRAEKSLKELETNTKKASQSNTSFFDTLKKNKAALSAFAGAAGVLAFKRFMQDSIESASNLQESINAVNVTFGESAEGIRKLGENAADSVGLANSEFNQLAVGFAAFVDSIDQGGGRTVQIMDDLTTRIADFASVMNLDVAEAADRFRSGLAGETEPLRKFGIDVSAAAVNARALEMGLAGSTKALSEQDKVLARYNLIMEQTEKTAGDFANTSNQLANLQRRLAAEFENAKAELGKAFIPALEKVLPLLIDVVKQLGKFGIELGVMIGVMSRAEAELIKYGIRTGEAADTTTALANTAREVAEEIRGMGRRGGEAAEILEKQFTDLFEAFDGGGIQLLDLRANFDEWVAILGLSDQEARVLARTLDRTLGRAFSEATERTKNFGIRAQLAADELEGINEAAGADRVLRQYADAVEDIGDEAATAAPSVQDLADAAVAVNEATRAAVDPIFKAAKAMFNMQDVLAEIDEDGKRTTKEWLAFAEANHELRTALLELGAGDINAGIQALADSLQVPFSFVHQMLQDLNIIDQFGNIVLPFDVTMDPADRALLNSIATLAGGSGTRIAVPVDLGPVSGFTGGRRPPAPPPPSTPQPGSTIVFSQHGNFLNRQQPSIVGEAGPELFTPQAAGTVLNLNQVFQRMEGDNVDRDIARGLILGGLGRFIETGF